MENTKEQNNFISITGLSQIMPSQMNEWKEYIEKMSIGSLNESLIYYKTFFEKDYFPVETKIRLWSTGIGAMMFECLQNKVKLEEVSNEENGQQYDFNLEGLNITSGFEKTIIEMDLTKQEGDLIKNNKSIPKKKLDESFLKNIELKLIVAMVPDYVNSKKQAAHILLNYTLYRKNLIQEIVNQINVIFKAPLGVITSEFLHPGKIDELIKSLESAEKSYELEIGLNMTELESGSLLNLK